jgi:hypothetical protein
MNFYDILLARNLSGGGGGEVTPESIVTATGEMTEAQAAQTRENIGAGEPLSPQDIADAAGDWLSENLDTPSTPPIDASLSVANAAADAKATGDALAAKADTDGEYDTLTAGVAKQLESTVGITDNAPYLFRTAGGSADIGDLETDKIVGGTVCWNQISPTSASSWTTWHTTITANANNGFNVKGDSQSNTNKYIRLTLDVGNVYLITFDVDIPAKTEGMTSNFVDYGIHDGSNSAYVNYLKKTRISTETALRARGFCIGKTTSTYKYLMLAISALALTDMTYNFENIVVINLTKMFGATVANYINSIETASEGAGVAFFQKLFPKHFYSYNAGALLSVKALSHDTVGFNAYDNSTGQAKVVGGNVYQITGVYTALSLNGETVTPDADGYFTPTQSGVLTVTGGNSTTTCVHLKWDGEKDGEWEPYVKHSYPLDANLELRGIPMLDANNGLYYDGDVYESDGTVARKMDKVNLGDLSWEYINGVFRTTNYYTKNAHGFCDAYTVTTNVNPTDASVPDKSICLGSHYWSARKRIYVKDSRYTNASTFKTAANGIYAVVVRETPTAEQAEPYQNPQQVDDFGTEEYVDTRTVPLPVGHSTFYQANLRAKLEMSPCSPDGDGDYIVRQTDGENEYVPLVVQPCMMVAAQSFAISPGVSVAAGATYNTYSLNLAVETQSGYTAAFAYITGCNGSDFVTVKAEITNGVLDATVCNISTGAATLTEIHAQIIYTRTA